MNALSPHQTQHSPTLSIGLSKRFETPSHTPDKHIESVVSSTRFLNGIELELDRLRTTNQRNERPKVERRARSPAQHPTNPNPNLNLTRTVAFLLPSTLLSQMSL
jgi:hypothetical protein